MNSETRYHVANVTGNEIYQYAPSSCCDRQLSLSVNYFLILFSSRRILTLIKMTAQTCVSRFDTDIVRDISHTWIRTLNA